MKSYVKFQLNMSKHIGDKRRKLYFQYSTFQMGHNSNQKLTQIKDTGTRPVVK